MGLDLDRLRTEWDTVSAAPWSFAGVACTVFVLTVGGMHFLHEATIAGKDATIEDLNTQINGYKDRLNGASPQEAKDRMDSLQGAVQGLQSKLGALGTEVQSYKDKLNGATPDEAKARIDTLRSTVNRLQASVTDLAPKLNSLKVRSLSSVQRDAMTAILKSGGGSLYHFEIQSDMSCQDCGVFATSLLSAFPHPPWIITMAKVLGPSGPSPKGIAVLTPDPSHPSPEIALVTKALQAADIDFDLEGGAAMYFQPGALQPIKTAAMLITLKLTP
jgi:uncharacterized protein YukE